MENCKTDHDAAIFFFLLFFVNSTLFENYIISYLHEHDDLKVRKDVGVLKHEKGIWCQN